MSRVVTMPSLMMMTSIVSEESLARDTHTDTHTDVDRLTLTSSIFVRTLKIPYPPVVQE